MKLSDAIRIGSRQTLQAFEIYVTEDGRTCALGAALIGYGYNLDNISFNYVSLLLANKGCDLTKKVMHPVKDADVSLYSAIVTLNDFERWPRERIAHWLEELGL